MIFLLILAFFTTFYQGTDNAGVVVGPEYCHIGVEVQPTASLFALCYVPDNSGDLDKGA